MAPLKGGYKFHPPVIKLSEASTYNLLFFPQYLDAISTLEI
jgi:hypothetical protein